MTAHSSESGKPGNGDKRERILDAAEHVFAAHGFFAAKVSEIAEKAGVADGTIYLYFKSKDDILISLFERRMRQLNTALKESITGKPPREQLREFIRTYLRLCHEEPAAAEVLTIELRQSAKFMKEYDNVELADFLRMLAGIVTANGLDDGVPAHMAARMIFGVLDEIVIAWVLAKAPLGGGTRPKKFDIVRAADWVIKLVETGLAAKEST